MANRDGYYQTGISDITEIGALVFTKRGGDDGNIQGLLNFQINPPAIYKNYGWYATGLNWEIWLSTGAPNTSNPSGNILTLVQNIRIF